MPEDEISREITGQCAKCLGDPVVLLDDGSAESETLGRRIQGCSEIWTIPEVRHN